MEGETVTDRPMMCGVPQQPKLTPFQEGLAKVVYGDTNHVPFDGGGMREPVGDRPRFELLWPKGVPFDEQFLTRCAVHMAKGAHKYASRNWEDFSDTEALERCESSAHRHLMQWLTGVDDGEDHAAAIVFNLMAAEHVRAKLRKAEQVKYPMLHSMGDGRAWPDRDTTRD